MHEEKFDNLIADLVVKYDLEHLQKKYNEIANDEPNINIAFLGEFSTGKSSILNALIGTKVLPAFTKPTTSVITEISSGKENKCLVDKIESTEEISFGDLASELMKTDINKKVSIQLNNAKSLPENFKFIDTPGISSLDNLHEDITYGYLPSVDVAFVCLNVHLGDMTKTSFDFLKKISKNELSKIYFIVNFIDQIPTENVIAAEKSFKKAISEIVEKPRIIMTSAKKGIEANDKNDEVAYKLSGIQEIWDIIHCEVVAAKVEVQEKKRDSQKRAVLVDIMKALEFKKSSISWSYEEQNNAIAVCSADIEQIRSDIHNIKMNFRDGKDKVMLETGRIVKEASESISMKATKSSRTDTELDIDEEVKYLIEGLDHSYNRAFRKLNDLQLNNGNMILGNTIKLAAERGIYEMNDALDIVSDVGTFVLTALVVPGGSSGLDLVEGVAGVTATINEVCQQNKSGTDKTNESGEVNHKDENESDKSSEDSDDDSTSKMGTVLKSFGTAIAHVNPVSKVVNIIRPYAIDKRLNSILSRKIINLQDYLFDEIESSIEFYIEDNHLTELISKEKMIVQNLNDKKAMKAEANDFSVELEEDIRKILDVI